MGIQLFHFPAEYKYYNVSLLSFYRYIDYNYFFYILVYNG